MIVAATYTSACNLCHPIKTSTPTPPPASPSLPLTWTASHHARVRARAHTYTRTHARTRMYARTDREREREVSIFHVMVLSHSCCLVTCIDSLGVKHRRGARVCAYLFSPPPQRHPFAGVHRHVAVVVVATSSAPTQQHIDRVRELYCFNALRTERRRALWLTRISLHRPSAMMIGRKQLTSHSGFART